MAGTAVLGMRDLTRSIVSLSKGRKMSRRRRPTKSGRRKQDGRPSAVAAASSVGPLLHQGRSWRVPVIVVFLALLAVYSVWFYRAELVGGIQRTQILYLLLIPDQIFSDGWLGGDIGNVRFLDRLPLFALAAVIWAVAWLLGLGMLRVCRVTPHLTRLESHLLAIGTGLSLLSLYTLAVGLLGGLRHSLLFAAPPVVVAIGFAYRQVLQFSRSRRKPLATAAVEQTGHPTGRFDAICRVMRCLGWWWLGLPFAVVIMWSASLPPASFDVLEYHLQVPKEWYQQGQITFLPHNVYGNMPLGAEMLALFAMVVMPGDLNWWWGALAGKLLLAGYAPLTAMLIYAAGARFASRRAGLIAAVIYISTPWVAFVSVQALIDGVLAYYLLAAAFVFKLWSDRQRDEPSEDTRPLTLLAGFLAGTAVACKYSGVLFVAIPLTAGLIWESWRSRLRWTLVLSILSLYLLGNVAGCGLWLGKNWILTGNPTYPLLYSVFGGETRTAEKDAQWRQAHEVPRDQLGRRYSLGQAARSLADVLGRSRWHHVLILPFSLLIFSRRRRLRQAAFWGVALMCVLVSWWLFTHRIDRFWVPALPLMSLLAGIGATWSWGRGWRYVLGAVLSCALVVNWLLISSAYLGPNPLFVSLVQLREDPRISASLPMHLYLNQQLTDADRVLLVGDAAAFDLQIPVLYSTCFDDCLLEQFLRGRDRNERLELLQERGVTHVLVDWSEIARYRDTYGFTDYVTPNLVHQELVRDQQILRPVALEIAQPAQVELFEVNVAP
jgi:hypothetical protein